MAKLFAITTALLAAATVTCQAGETGPKYVPAAQNTRVFVVAGLGARCSSDVPPRVEITRQPSKGQVTIQPGIPTTIQYSLSGHCIGTPARGIGINYVSNTGASGEDHFSIAARMPSGGIATRDFKIKIRD